MSKIATKTKLLKYGIEQGKEVLVLDVCDFSDGQVEALERCVRYPEDTVMMTVADPTDGEAVAPMEFRVKVGPVQLQRQGQKVPLTEFNGRTAHVTKIRSLVKSGAIVVVTFEQIRKQMTLDEAGKEATTKPWPKADAAKADDRLMETRTVPLPASYRASAEIDLYIDGESLHRARCRLSIPKTPVFLAVSDGAASPQEALCGCIGKVQDWLESQTKYSKRSGVEAKIVACCKAWADELAARDKDTAEGD